MSDPWSPEGILKLRARIEASATAPAPERAEPCHDAAALLTSFVFDPVTHRGEGGANLAADSRPAPGEAAGRWSLKNEVRKRVLGRLKTRSALLQALHSTPERPKDLVQQTMEALLEGTAKPLNEQGTDELAATLQVIDWFSATDLKPALPSAEDVRARIEYAAFLQPLRSLAGKHFRGRTIELAALATYAGATQGVTDLRQRPPLLIFGPGGMGKSTLVAKFILEHLNQFPVIYLDVDRPGLVAEEPITLLAEALYQLGLQFPDSNASARELRKQWLQEMARAHEMATEGAQVLTHGRTRILKEFQVFVSDLNLSQRNVLLVIDTFEEVYRRSRAFVKEVFDFLNELQGLIPSLRTVLAGRHEIPDFKWEPMELSELDQDAAQGFLEALGIGSVIVRKRLASLLRGNPLSMRLAAEVLQQGEADGLTDELSKLTNDTEIQGILYTRILGHAHPEIRAIAHPGLILRRITADLIRKVLATPCGVTLSTEGDAERLFSLLQSELSLVNPEGDAVRHRSDVRQVMLRPLKKDQPDKIRAIEDAAVLYYETHSDLISRAEEIYHRLSLGQSPELIIPRWLPGIEESLYSAVDELEGPSRAYLASRLGIELYDEDWDSVEQSTWEEYAYKAAADLLRLDRPLEALRILRRRSARLPQSRLPWLEAQALNRTGQRLEAREVARANIGRLLHQPEWWRPLETSQPPRSGQDNITIQLMDWFAGPKLVNPPTADQIRLQQHYLEFLQPIQLKAGKVFVHRDREFAALHSYVSGGGAVVNLRDRPPLLVFGPGGIGKSSLVARFVQDRLKEMPLIFIDAQGSGLSLEDPGLLKPRLLAIAVQQLGLQFPAFIQTARKLAEAWWNDQDPGRAFYSARESFRSFVSELSLLDRALLLWIDDLDQLQFKSPAALGEIYSFLEELQPLLPHLRIIVVSRFPFPDYPFERLELGRLDQEASVSLLAAHGLETGELSKRITEIAQGHPEALELALEAVQKADTAGLKNIEETASAVPAYLALRVLERIPNLELRNISENALLLRRVTPEVLREILAGPSGLGMLSEAQASELFRGLQGISLFGWDGDALRPSPDIRRILTGILRRDNAEGAKPVDQAAVRYYAGRGDLVSRAEEVYHRFALGESPKSIDARWMTGIEPLLRDAIEDFEGSARLDLASRLGVDLSDKEWESADQATWEDHATRRSKELLKLNRPREALEMVQKRSTRLPKSPLFALEAEALFATGQRREALLAAREGLKRWPEDPDLPAFIERCEAALGAQETSARKIRGVQGPDTEHSFQLHDHDSKALLEALNDALPMGVDLVNVVRLMNGDTWLVAQGLPAIIAWATREHRLHELITVAASYKPESKSLQSFLARFATRIEHRSEDPLEAYLLSGAQPFLNRAGLREFMHGLLSERARQRILIVRGPPGSGKSYTAHFVDHCVSATRGLVLAKFHDFGFESRLGLNDFVQELYVQFGWRWEETPADSSFERRIRLYVDMIRARVRQTSATKVILLDFLDRENSQPEILSLVEQLALHLAADPDCRMALVLLGFNRELPLACLPAVLTETLGDLSAEDIAFGLRRILHDAQQISEQGVQEFTRTLIQMVKPGPQFNGRLNKTIASLMAQLAQSTQVWETR